MNAGVLVLLGIPAFVVGIHLLFSHLSGWRILAQAWPATRMSSPPGRLADFAEVDWSFTYRWSVEVRILETGVHCQPRRLLALNVVLFHPPFLIPWSDIYEVKQAIELGQPAIEVRARTRRYDFRVCYPSDVGFPPEKLPKPTSR